MQKTFLIENQETLFPEAMAFLDWCQKEDKIVIYINSGGGSCWKFESILTRLEEMKQEGYTIVLRWIFIASMAFNIFYKWTGDKILEKDCDATVHRTANNAYLIKKWIVRASDPTDIWRIEYFETTNEDIDYSFLTEEENIKLDNWFDIYLNPIRLQDIFHK